MVAGTLAAGCFAVFHGLAHGAAVPGGPQGDYVTGLMIATAALFGVGLLLGKTSYYRAASDLVPQMSTACLRTFARFSGNRSSMISERRRADSTSPAALTITCSTRSRPS